MGNTCSNHLIVVGLQEDAEEFAKTLELTLYGQLLEEDSYYRVWVPQGQKHLGFSFKTNWQPPFEELISTSAARKEQTFLLDYSCWESCFRGQAVIQQGAVIERVRREGYNGPAYLWSDITHPITSLFTAYLNDRLADCAAERLQDAITIVSSLKNTLEDRRFTESHYRACGDDTAVRNALAGLSEMLATMTTQAKRISFQGVFLDEGIIDGALVSEQQLEAENITPQNLDDVEDL
jgi:hypothetical protein